MNGKCKIKIDERLVDLRFGLPANRLFFEALAETPDVLVGDQLNEIGIAALLYAGYRNACLISDDEAVITRGRFIEYVEDAQLTEDGKAEMQNAIQCYNDSAYTKNYTDKVNTVVEDIKKKLLTSIELNQSATASSE